MHKNVTNKLRCPQTNGTFHLELVIFSEAADGRVMEGILKEGDNIWYPVNNGVPCFLTGELRPNFSDFAKLHKLPHQVTLGAENVDRQKEQELTNETFSDKWRKFTTYGMDEAHKPFLLGWYCKKLGLSNEKALAQFYKNKLNILEVGPGSGFNSRYMALNSAGEVMALDISEAAHTTFGNIQDLNNCNVVQADLMDAPFDDESFDFIIADGVLHHTPNTKDAVFALYEKLQPGGQFFFYIYRRMGAARAYVDEYIRSQFTSLKPEDCYKACEPLTELGRELSKLDAKITLEKPIDVLGIPAGEHDVQRLLYYNFVKCFWNDAFDYETNNMVNFDWYHPHNAWQHSEEEVTEWMEELGVINFQFNDSNPNGISILLTKPN